MSHRHKERANAFAVVRIDLDPELSWPDRVTVKEVVSSKDLAFREAQRLNELNSEKRCIYFVTHTRVFPPGESAGSGSQ
jgi:hypothetical protein